MAGTLEVPAEGSPNTTEDPKVKAAIKRLNELLNAENRVQWYKPVSIAAEQERESATYGTLTTPDEVKSVILPENALLVVGYDATAKSSNAGAGRIAIFLGTNQVQADEGSTEPGIQNAATFETGFTHITSSAAGLVRTDAKGWTGNVTTGQILGRGVFAKTEGQVTGMGGLSYIFAAAGTYDVSVRYKATTGKVVAKERKLWVGVIGV